MAVAIVVIVLVMLVIVSLVRAIKVVPQSSAMVIERFGRHARTLRAGLNFVVPFIDRVRQMIDLREQVVPFPPQPATTKDNLVVRINTIVYFQVIDPRAATYEIANYIQAIEQLIITTLRNTIGGMDLEQALASREQLNAGLRGVLGEATGRWGVRVNRVELKEIETPLSFRESTEERLRAERDKRAAILRAEGAKQAALLKAETEREVAAILAGGDEAARGTPPSGVEAVPAPEHAPLRKDDPRRIGRYQLLARLGSGGMGTVYLGRSLGRRLIAVKVIRSEFAADPAFRKRFTREIAAARRVGGYHTAPVVDADPHGDPPWLATEYIPGPSLHDVLKLHGELPAKTIHALAVGVAEALEGIHACGIIHRDLKPANIIVSSAGPRVIDFGIARALDSTALTRADHVIGTQGFLAPEQLTGALITPAADLYAYGMVICLAAGAASPPDGESMESALSLLPSRLVGIIARCLDHDPNARPTPTEILEQLTHNDSSEDWLPPPVRTMVDLHSAPTASAP